MTLRTVNDPLRTPPADAVTLGVARHLTAGYTDPKLLDYHRDRAALVHDLVSATSIDVIDWGRTDREDPPNEVVEIIVAIAPALITAGATLIASWMGQPPKGETDKRTVLGVALRRADGTQIQFEYKTSRDLEEMRRTIRDFLDQSKTDMPPA
jgi:hypothetical protein